jgi:transcriptional regulator with XRE-family HTH domain
LALLREVRVQARLTQVEVAKKLGVVQSFVSNYEKGERRLDILELRGLSEVVGMTLGDFAKRLEKATTSSRD